MISKFEELGIQGSMKVEEVEQILLDKLGVDLDDVTNALSQQLQQNAEELAKNFVVVAPFDDYGELLEDEQQIVQFFQQRAAQPDNWALSSVHGDDSMVIMEFSNQAVDDGESMSGYAYVNLGGKLLRTSVQGEP